MSLIKGSKHRENYKKLETMGVPYNIELSLINERIKNLNDEQQLFTNNPVNKLKTIKEYLYKKR